MKRDRKSPARTWVARNIRRLRAERGLSQEALAFEAGLHRTNLSRLERAAHAVSIDNLYWIAKALGAPLEALVAGPPPRKRKA